MTEAPKPEHDLQLQSPRPPDSTGLHRLGFGLTAAWVIAWLVYLVVRRDAVLALTPNEAGDFLAGIFAPLAFLWLVLGFFQQGQELRHSADALWLQGEELRNSVQQQRELVKATRDQMAFDAAALADQRDHLERTAQPAFNIRLAGSNMSTGEKNLYRFVATNLGRSCTALTVDVPGSSGSERDELATGQQIAFDTWLPLAGEETLDCVLSYLDANLTAQRQLFQLRGYGGGVEIVQPTLWRK